ncbi:maleylpyruvate isomerase family mycothiol-dependent enzyme [Streptomyces gibsoniae]|uniref:Maleylpyruvate isomerase family mycothiol-dependent enzyme n=1 Tax=Streptomyces gibsoniae TaxID=3075529 RepID=A0ABU2U7L8_9ACTN|nr:maleylpyruvate isomerase family mycothiol-dependent enzyme [Streptomyces sp. DSM 41699]MDT0469075.1 maleylpyruvate isomerase family mycothiol-dependent enzyme [Streptomyces sp. DSM 41699]
MNQPPAPLPLATGTYLAALREEAAALVQLLRAIDPATPVATCGSWTMHDLGTHLGQASRFAAALLRTGQLPREQFAPPAGQQTADWYAEGAAAILATLEETDPATPTWAFGLEGAVAALWFRRVAQDTAVHLVDAQLATGVEVHVDPLIATDGVDEVFAVMVPRVWQNGDQKPLPAPVALRTTDTGHSWLIQPGDMPQAMPGDSGPAAATVEAPAAELLLALWKRQPASPEWISGDITAANALLAARLTL